MSAPHAPQPGTGQALRGVRVLDFGQYVAGPLAAMLLADHGATVTRVDPPGGPRWDHAANAMLQRGKRSIVLDLEQAVDVEIARRLMSTHDVLIEGFRPGVMERLGLGASECTALNPGLLYCSLPGFASDDPRAQLRGWEGVVSAPAGHYGPVELSRNGASPTTGGQPAAASDAPAYSPVPLASAMAAYAAVNAILAALIARRRSGSGQVIEVPLFAAAFEATNNVIQTVVQSCDPPRAGPMAGPLVALQCGDGRWIQILLIVGRHHRWFAESLFPAEWLAEGLGDPARVRNDPELMDLFVRRSAELFRTKPAAEWDRLVNGAGVPASVFLTSSEWLHDEHAEAIGAVIAVDDPYLGATRQAGAAVTMGATPSGAGPPRRALDADRAAVLDELADAPSPRRAQAQPPDAELSRALDGIRVIDTTVILAGPTSGRILAEFGAEVIKVNEPGYWLGPWVHPNSGKRTALIDLSTEAGQALMWPLVERSDVFIENLARGRADALGIGESDVRARRPDIIYASVSAYTHDGPRGGFRGYEHVAQARTGIGLRRGAGHAPVIDLPMCDYGAGHLAAMGILLGLYHRANTGESQRVQSSLVQAGTFHQVPFMVEHAGRVWDEPAGPGATGEDELYRLYEAVDGWFFLAAVSPGDRERLATAAGVMTVSADALSAVFRTASAAVWIERLVAAGLAAQPLRRGPDLLDDPVLEAQGLSVSGEYPGIGWARKVGPAPRLSGTPLVNLTPSPPPGADTRAIVAEAGFADRFDDLVASRVVAEALAPDIAVFL